jgi:mannose-1-phosphate guanylyltransferase
MYVYRSKEAYQDIMAHAYALIMAGGAGTRLWPLSREKRPKPLLPLVDDTRSMIQMSVERLEPLFPKERILIVAGIDHIPLIQEQLPDLPAENFIVEPMGRDSAPAAGLGTIHIRRRDPEAVVAVLTADHYIADEAAFRAILGAAVKVAGEGMIATLGITPTYPSSGFGYIEQGELQQTVNGVEIYRLKRFVEKPDEQTAEMFLAAGSYSWNSGMFIWGANRIMAEFARHAPEVAEKLELLSEAIGTPGYDALLAETWPKMKKISVDYALMEHIHERIVVIPADIGWNDIGNFEALYDILSDDREDHVISGRQPILIDSSRMLIFSKRLVAAIGVHDLVIIDTEDAILVCPRDRAQDIKQLVEKLKKEQQHEYL